MRRHRRWRRHRSRPRRSRRPIRRLGRVRRRCRPRRSEGRRVFPPVPRALALVVDALPDAGDPRRLRPRDGRPTGHQLGVDAVRDGRRLLFQRRRAGERRGGMPRRRVGSDLANQRHGPRLGRASPPPSVGGGRGIVAGRRRKKDVRRHRQRGGTSGADRELAVHCHQARGGVRGGVDVYFPRRIRRGRGGDKSALSLSAGGTDGYDTKGNRRDVCWT
mmetsp:Transcript_18269/g.52759  ORF Transcript_18269/g.52759 Transcript_18269/m.52759 type:complete len:218 (-) Transcript_18269:231-884(-)